MKDVKLLGVDVGSGSVRVAVFNTEGDVLALAKSDYPTYKDKEGWSEQDAVDYYEALLSCLKSIGKDNLFGVEAVGICGQTPTDIFVDKDGAPVRRAIMWRDTRAKAQLERQNERFTHEQLLHMAGCPIPNTPNWTTLRMAWVKENEPDVYSRIYKVLQPKDYLIYKLTGRFVTDLWSARPFANVNTGLHNDEIFSFIGYDKTVSPEIYRVADTVGRITNERVIECGLAPDVCVVCGSSDGFASMVSSGIFEEPGLAFNCTGTSEMAGVSAASFIGADGMYLFPSSLTGEACVCFGPTQSGGSSLLWLAKNILGMEYDELIASASRSVPGSRGLVFLPYIMGERAPIWDGDAKGCFFGLKDMHTRDDMARSVLEGVAFSIRSLIEASGVDNVKRLRLIGGGSRVPLWCQIRADVLGIPLEVVECSEACAQGGAAIAGIGIGVYDSYKDAALKMCNVGAVYLPSAENREVYDKLYGIYRALYESTKNLMKEL